MGWVRSVTREEIEKKLIEIGAEQLGLALIEIRPDNRLIHDLGCDSLDVVELMINLEEEFFDGSRHSPPTDEEWETLGSDPTVAACIDMIAKKLGAVG